MVALSHCPFCGGQAVYSRIPGKGFSVLCRGCGAIGMLAQSTRQDALGNAWNRRAHRVNHSMRNALAPCPFCAARVATQPIAGGGLLFRCPGCGMMASFADSDTEGNSRQLWQRRKS